MWILPYSIPSSDVESEQRRIVEALMKGGYDPAGLDTAPLARQAVARAAIHWVTAVDIAIVEAPWTTLPDGGVEIRFQFESEEDHDNALIALD